MRTPLSKFSHVDLVISSIERSLRFYRGLLEPIGWSGLREMRGEQGETIYYLSDWDKEHGSRADQLR